MGKKQSMKKFVSWVNAHQRVAPAEEDFNDQVDRITHSVDPSQLFLQPPLSSPNKLRNKAAMVTGMEGMHGLSNVDSPRPDWLQLLPSAPLPAPETNTESRRGTVPPGERPAV